MLVTFLLPCLNEEKSIGLSIDEIPREDLKSAGYQVEVLIVDGHSQDNSIAIARDRGARVIQCERGYGIQYRKGFECAKGEIIIAADSDCTYPIADSLRYLETMKKGGYDFLSVNRFGFGIPPAMPVVNIIGNLLLTKAANKLFGLRLGDSQSGMWIIKRRALESLRLTSDGMSLSQEIKLEAFDKLVAAEVTGAYRIRVGEPKLNLLMDGARNLAFLACRRIRGIQ